MLSLKVFKVILGQKTTGKENDIFEKRSRIERGKTFQKTSKVTVSGSSATRTIKMMSTLLFMTEFKVNLKKGKPLESLPQ